MLTLPVVKPRTYISPSAFKVWLNCQNSFYQYYLAGHVLVQRGTNRAAGIGTVFDAILKDFLNRKLELNDPRLTVENLLRFIVWEDGVDVSEIMEVATEVAAGYIKNRMYEILLKFDNVQLDKEIFKIMPVQYKGQLLQIPILGILDANLTDNIANSSPFDWKLRGFNSKTSPTKGYHKRWDSSGNALKPHKDSIYPHPLEGSNYDWALQMLWYNWITENTARNYIIHEICWDGRDWNLSEHKGSISKTFEQEVLNQLAEMWLNISRLDCEIEEPTCTMFKCEKYSSVCSVAEHCYEYQRTLGDPEYRMLYT